MKIKVWQPPEGPVRIMMPCWEQRVGESDDAYIERVAAHAEWADPTLQGLPSALIDPSDLPATTQWRNAWRLNLSGEGPRILERGGPEKPATRVGERWVLLEE